MKRALLLLAVIACSREPAPEPSTPAPVAAPVDPGPAENVMRGAS